MIQYRPSDRPSVNEVLAHPFFWRCPVLVEVPGPPKNDGRWVKRYEELALKRAKELVESEDTPRAARYPEPRN